MNFFHAVNATPGIAYTPRIEQTNLVSSYDPLKTGALVGTTLYDIVGSNNIGLYNGLDQNFDPGGWFDLDGIVEYGRSAQFNWNTDAFSFGVWVRKDDNNGTQVISGFGDANGLEGLYIYQSASGIYARIEDGAANAVQAINTSAAVLNTWLYVFVTWDGTTITLYVYNASGLSSTNTASSTSVNLNNNPINPRVIMSEIGYYMDGQLGEMHLYNTAHPKAIADSNYDQTKSRYGY